VCDGAERSTRLSGRLCRAARTAASVSSVVVKKVCFRNIVSVLDNDEIRKFLLYVCTACLNGILWSKDIRKERELNGYNASSSSSSCC
jgi:hypothetical protein